MLQSISKDLDKEANSRFLSGMMRLCAIKDSYKPLLPKNCLRRVKEYRPQPVMEDRLHYGNSGICKNQDLASILLPCSLFKIA